MEIKIPEGRENLQFYQKRVSRHETNQGCLQNFKIK